MKTITVKLDESKKEYLNLLAKSKGETISRLISELIEEFINRNREKIAERKDLHAIMKLSEPSFHEWENEDDAIYDTL